MGPLNSYEYPMDVCSEEGYGNETWQTSSRISWYCSDDFDETRLPSAFSEMGIEETDEGRLSRALQSWMSDYVIKSIEPMNKPALQPIFSGKLGKDREKIILDRTKRVPSVIKRSKSERKGTYMEKDPKFKRRQNDSFKLRRSVSEMKGKRPCKDQKHKNETGRLKRTPSDDSISTHYSSLFELSSLEEKSDVVTFQSLKSKKRGRHKNEIKERQSPEPVPSKWVELANKRSLGAFEKFMRAQNVLQIDTFGTNKGQFESEAFELMDPNERKMIFNCGKQRGIRYNKELKKSGSTTTLNINIPLQRQQKKLRTLSAGHKPLSKGLNLEEARQQLARERQLAMARQRQESRSGRPRRRSTHSRLASARSEISSNVSCATPSIRSISPATTYEKPETMWKGDKEILEMDLRRGLTTRVQKRIKTTTSALERVTGYGENNALQKTVGRCEDFPHLVDDDYGFKPKIIQKMRISPYLSNVIRTDIKVRMGRPRYHEIKVRDLEWWNRGQSLNRAHRNLKVFNWLHSLREDDFEHLLDLDIIDKPPESRDDIANMHVESADEPDIKPLYQTDFFK
ncbi:uncharacterized protein [Mytilus edulis]|uniref:uncharacterized protein n=1 Tax=Mytilus edulis TaxID=6550 RepID=UPI0039EF3AE0